MQPPMPPPAAANAERSRSTIILIVATVVHALGLLPWFLMLMFSPMMYDSGASATANLMMAAILGWPVAVLVSLIVGWWMRSYRGALIGSLGPIGFALVMAVVIQIVSPSFFNLPGLLPDPKALKPADQELAGLSLSMDEDAILKILGEPPAAHTPDLRALSPQDAVAAARQQEGIIWEYQTRGITVTVNRGMVHEIRAGAPWTGTTPRGLSVGADVTRAKELYGDRYGTNSNFDAAGAHHSYWYDAKGFTLAVSGTPDDQVAAVTVRVRDY